jgi:hypothetical protein
MIRLSIDEVHKLLRLAAAKGVISPTAGPTIGSVADAFGIQPLQLEALLQEVRAQEAEAPQWRKLRAIGAAAAVLALFGISFTVWRSMADGSRNTSEPVVSAGTPGVQGGPGLTTNYAGASFGRAPAGSAQTSMPVSEPGVGVAQTPAYLSVDEYVGERPALAEKRYVKTDATDLNAARARAGRYGSLDSSNGGRSDRINSTVIAR